MEPDESLSAEPCASVVLCVRNGAAFVGRQLAALAAQDLDTPWELVVVDNGSRDSTAAVVAPWVERQPTWRLVAEPAPQAPGTPDHTRLLERSTRMVVMRKNDSHVTNSCTCVQIW